MALKTWWESNIFVVASRDDNDNYDYIYHFSYHDYNYRDYNYHDHNYHDYNYHYHKT